MSLRLAVNMDMLTSEYQYPTDELPWSTLPMELQENVVHCHLDS
jgi:hypothetical protein